MTKARTLADLGAVTSSPAELNFSTNVTSDIQAQLNTKVGLTGGKLGIGTASPSEMLEVFNATSPAIKLNDGGDFKGIIRLGGNDLEIRGSSGSMEFYTGNADGDSSTQQVTITSAGNVGIGTSSPTNFSNGTVVEAAGGSNTGAFLASSNSGTVVAEMQGNNADGLTYFGSRTNHPVVFRQNGSERMRISSAGKVGIGTTAPQGTFVVQASNAKSGVDNAGSKHLEMGIGSGGCSFMMTDGHTMSFGHQPYANRGSDTNFTERMRIDNLGNITTPDVGTGNTRFGDQAGDAIASGGTYNSTFGFEAGTDINTGDRNNCFGYRSGLNITTGNDNCCFGNSAGGHSNLGITTTNDHVMIGRGAGQTTNSSDANIFIGTYAGIFHTTGGNNCVVGYTSGYAGGASNYLLAGSGNTIFGNYSNVSAANGTLQVVIGQGAVGKGNSTALIQASNGAYQSNNSSSWSTTSDRRLKKNIVDSTIGLAEINQLQIRNFEYRTEDEITELDGRIDKVDTQGVQVGVIAQEIQEILPNCVKETSQGVLRVDSDNLTWHLIKAVQELTARLEALEGA